VTRDEALLWLNDRIGKTVHVSVVLQRDYDVLVLEGDGPLQHWTEGPDARDDPGRGPRRLVSRRRYELRPDRARAQRSLAAA
jgi:hypothetical protein